MATNQGNGRAGEEEIRRRLGTNDSLYHTLFNSMAEGFSIVEVIFDEAGAAADTRFLEVNAAFERLTGLTDARGKTMKTLVPDIDPHWIEEYGRVARTGKPILFTEAIKQIGPKWIDLSAFRIGGEESALVGILFSDITERVHTEQALRAREEEFRAFFEVTGVGAAEANNKGEFVRVNDRYCQLTGYSREELLRMTPLELDHPDDRMADQAQFAEILAGNKESFTVEKRYIRKDGAVIWVRVTANLVRDSEGKPYRTAAVIEDITEQKIASESVRQSEKLFRDLANSIPQLVWIADEAGRIFWFSDRWYEYTGKTFEEARGYGWKTIPHPDYVERVAEHFRRSMETGEPWEDTFPMLSKTGEYRWFLSRAEPIKDDRGRVLRWFGTNTDVTAQLQSQQQLKEQARELELAKDRVNSILESIAEMYLMLDNEGRIVDMNHNSETYVFRAPKERFIGKNLWEIAPQEKQSEFYRQYMVAVNERRDVHFEEKSTIVPKWLEVHAYPSEDGKYLSIYFHDISSRKQAQIDLEQRTRELTNMNEELQRLGSYLSHDLRAPLRTMRGFADALSEDLKGSLDEEHRDYLDRITSGANQMDEIIQDLLRLTRLDVSNLEIQPVDLREIASTVMEELKQQAGEGDVNLVLKGDLTAKADRRLMTVAMTNLLSNAVKFSAQQHPAVVEVGCDAQDGRKVYYVRDNGVGFDMRAADQLFQPFKRLHAQAMFAGTGLGLPIVQKVIFRHRGNIWADSAPGRGATFYFTLNS